VFLNQPRGIRDPEIIAERLRMLDTVPAVQPLRRWSADLADRHGAVVPFFDPVEAGVDARVLVLPEAPGPRTNADNQRPGSGFISIDNDDQTATNCWTYRRAAGLESALHWNIVVGDLGPASTKPTASELREGAAELVQLRDLLPSLKVVVLAGRYTQAGWNRHVAPVLQKPITTVRTWHPSPLSMNQPGHREEFEAALRHAAARAF
jgi:hypothetical protein